jgi:peptide/nickel transport system substrate-binding protein
VTKKKFLWIAVSCMMALSLVLASCETAEEGKVKETEEGPEVVVITETETGGAVVEEEEEVVDPNRPRYGGTIVFLATADISNWNPGSGACQWPSQDGIVLEQITNVDWTRGLAGTGETTYVEGITDYTFMGPCIAESWETPDVGIWVLTIRQGIHWAYHPDFAASRLVAGRELTADDVVASLEYMRDTPLSCTQCSEPGLINAMTAEQTGEWEVTVLTPEAPTTGYLWLMGGGGAQYVWPREFLEQYGTSNEWTDTVGTGPFILEDYVTSSAMKYVRNDNYWAVNPVGPGKGDKMPYPDGITMQIIPDLSTRLAAFRTGKADRLAEMETLTKEDYDYMMKTNPEIQSAQTITAPLQVSGRVDISTDPFSNKKVRHAMMLAIDHPTIVRDLYGGHAELLDSPSRKLFTTIYTPLEELPEEVQELYGYNPTKAKQLLTDAGYPDGFSVTLLLQNTPEQEQAASLLKDYWDDVGIELELQVLEPSIYIGMWVGHKAEDLFLSNAPGGTGALFVRYSMGYFRGPNIFNNSHVNDPPGTDPIIEAAYQNQCKYVMVDYPSADAVTKEAYKYCLGEAFLIPMPAPHSWRVWQPWLKNYHGEGGGYKFWLKYAWLDQDLKESMTGRR